MFNAPVMISNAVLSTGTDGQKRRRNRRSAGAVLTAVLGSALVMITPASASATSTPTSVKVKDAANDVLKNWSSNTHHKADLDLRAVSAATKGGNVTLTVRVADLKPAHLKEQVRDGWHSIPTTISAFVYFGNLRWQVTYGSFGQASADAMNLKDVNKQIPNPCLNPDSTSRIRQKADYAKNTVVFTVPVDCMPRTSRTARVNGMTFWEAGAKRVRMWDDFHPNGDYRKGDVRSKPFRYR
ncbi:hypothetical protein [Actinoplanes sp. NPDC049802]|uniref:hypothetical protein n=1 Tax=Actinoplanes sp. NPDC049802 TaxID=3154742 RepID=UPI0033E8C441